MTTDFLAGHRREARERIEAVKTRFARWTTAHAERLAAMHPDVSAEVRALVFDRLLADKHKGLTDDDVRLCQMRVASRLRIRRYGRCTDDEETARQLREVLAGLNGAHAEAEAA